MQQMQQAQQREQEAYELEKADKMADIRSKMARAAKDTAEAEAQDIENDIVQSGIDELVGQFANG